MPLIHSSSKKAFSENVREMVHSGHPIKQAVAAAYSVKRDSSSHTERQTEREEHERRKYGK